MTTSSETITGVVEARNATGVRVGGVWFTVSKFRPLDPPSIGDQVRLSVDPKGFINAIEVLQAVAPSDQLTVSRDRQIARLSVLKSAAAFAANRPDIRSADVLRIAESWLAWVEE